MEKLKLNYTFPREVIIIHIIFFNDKALKMIEIHNIAYTMHIFV